MPYHRDVVCPLHRSHHRCLKPTMSFHHPTAERPSTPRSSRRLRRKDPQDDQPGEVEIPAYEAMRKDGHLAELLREIY